MLPDAGGPGGVSQRRLGVIFGLQFFFQQFRLGLERFRLVKFVEQFRLGIVGQRVGFGIVGQRGIGFRIMG
ncbi:MAG TPA: hypothetical protein VI547_07075 [Anaerolineales bacterium]|nr:hypothetical protein [Anaerolineales bacterium]